jgi:hypothetical protein
MAIQNEIQLLQAKRAKFRTAGLICGFAALTVGFWGGAVIQLLGGLIFFLWLALLICGFVFRSVAVNARESARFLEMQLAAQGLSPSLSPLNAKPVVDPTITGAAWNTANPAAASAPASTPAPAPQAASAAPAAPQASPAAPAANIESRLAKARRNKN